MAGILIVAQKDTYNKNVVCSEDSDCEKDIDVCYNIRKCGGKTLGYCYYIDPCGGILCDTDGDYEEYKDVCCERGKCDG